MKATRNRNGMIKCGALLALLLTTAATSNAAVVWNENLHGDLSDSGFTPSLLNFLPGSNEIYGLTGTFEDGLDRDYFSFTVPENAALTALRLLGTTTVSGAVSFIAIQAGPQVTYLPTGGGTPDFLGYMHYGPEHVGSDLLPSLIFGFNGPLTAGQYTVWIQETGGPAEYGLDFQVTPVPLPAAAWLLLSGAAGLAALGRRRKSVASKQD